MKLNWMVHENPVYNTASPMVFDLSHVELSTASFSTIAQGGFGKGALEIAHPTERLISNAVDGWLTKRVIAVDNSGRIAYEGYIAEIDATLGYHQFTRSVDQFANRVWVDYKWAGGACPKGSTCKGRTHKDESDVAATTTQTQYGVKERWVDISGQGILTLSLANATAIVTIKGALHSRQNEYELGLGQERPANSLRLTLWGYYSTLQWRKTTYGNDTDIDISRFVKNTLSARINVNSITENVNPFINTDQSQIDSAGRNITLNKERKPTYPQDLISASLIEGDSSGKEMYFQIWEDRVPYLSTRPSVPRYYSRYDDNRMWDTNHGLIPAYMVRAGGFVVSENLPEITDPFEDAYQRSRTTFVDQTVWDDVHERLQIPKSNNLATVERMLARARRKQEKYVA